MTVFRNGLFTNALVGAVWTFIVAISVAIVMSFATGLPFKPNWLISILLGAASGLLGSQNRSFAIGSGVAMTLAGLFAFGPVTAADTNSLIPNLIAHLATAVFSIIGIMQISVTSDLKAMNRHDFEATLIRLFTGAGYVFFTAIVLIPFYVMVMTSLKNQSELIQNPLDFSLDLSKGWGLFRSYFELFADFGFGTYLMNSIMISIITVLVTLAFSIPGAYAVARLRFAGRAAFSRSILLIYMVPMIVLALPIYMAFSMTGLRNSILGIVLVYPVTTIPVALYMLQGYFRGLPAEIEEAGLMDGLSRLAVIWKITLPLSLPALASVSLYVFMIAWNEFLLAFMLLDDPSKFTLTRGISSLNSSEIPRQHLMAGAVIATVPIMALFLGLERFMTKGLTAGSVKG